MTGEDITMHVRVKRIITSHAYEWVLKKHYAKRIPNMMFTFGIYKGADLKGVCCIGKPASPNLCTGICGEKYAFQVVELNRVVIDSDMPKNSASMLLGYALKYLKKGGGYIVVSYSDTDWGHVGYIYQATNWIYTGKTKERTDIGLEDGTHSRHYDKNSDYKKNRKHRSAKHRYVYFAGSRRQVKEWMCAFNYRAEHYPKGATERYDDSYSVKADRLLFT